MTNHSDKAPRSNLLLCQTEEGGTRIQVRQENETVWLTQKMMAELFQKDVRTINEHIRTIFDEGELKPGKIASRHPVSHLGHRATAGIYHQGVHPG